MRKFGLIGYPLGHSFSKQYFADKFLRENISDCTYENFPLQDISLFPTLLTEEPELCGLNVTIPYKSAIIKFLDDVEPEACEIGAVNVIKFRRTAEKLGLHGFNSDVTGIRDTLLPYIVPETKSAMVLGTGGSSKAVCFVLRKLGLDIIQISRSKKPGILTYSDITEDILKETSLIINATPLGMFPDIESIPELNYNLISEKHILFDLVYNPPLTAFLKRGQDRGCTVISGIKMLHSQAERAWTIWNDDSI
jgi:shikimate dehydrogenase